MTTIQFIQSPRVGIIEWGGVKRYKDSRGIERNTTTLVDEFDSMGDNGNYMKRHK